MRTNVYVDGFNLYYGAVRGTRWKWLDLRRAFSSLLSDRHQILEIKYFTAQVSGRLDPQQPIRQQTYWRALAATTPELKLYRGKFLTHHVSMPLAQSATRGQTALVLKTEEKGSDVNLAVHLLNDAWLDQYDCAVVVSNDSDLAEAMRLVRRHHPRKVIGLVFPRHRGNPSRELVQHATFVKKIGPQLLAASQFPEEIPGTSIRKPAGW